MKIIVLHPEPEVPSLAGQWRRNAEDWRKWAEGLGYEACQLVAKRMPEGVEEVWVVGPPVKDERIERLAKITFQQGLVVRDLRNLGFVPPIPSGGGYGMEGGNRWHPETLARMLSKMWVL